MTYLIKETYYYPNSQGKVSIYYCYQNNKNYWSTTQKEAFRFENRKAALQDLNKLRSKGSPAKLVRLKEKLPKPKVNTIFLDFNFPEPIPHIVTCLCEGDDETDQYVYVTNSVMSCKEDCWGMLEEYHQHIAEGKIKVIWEPK